MPCRAMTGSLAGSRPYVLVVVVAACPSAVGPPVKPAVLAVDRRDGLEHGNETKWATSLRLPPPSTRTRGSRRPQPTRSPEHPLLGAQLLRTVLPRDPVDTDERDALEPQPIRTPLRPRSRNRRSILGNRDSVTARNSSSTSDGFCRTTLTRQIDTLRTIQSARRSFR